MQVRDNILLLAIIILILSSCKKDPNPNDLCIPVFYKTGMQINGDTSQFAQYYPDYLFQKAFISSGFTPNDDSLNDALGIDIYWQGDWLYNDDIHTDWEIKVKILREGATVFNYQSFQNDGWFSVSWNGKDLIGITRPGLYEVQVLLFHNNIQIESFKGYTWLLIPDSENKLPAWSKCLKFCSNYDSRFGLVYQDCKEQFH